MMHSLHMQAEGEVGGGWKADQWGACAYMSRVQATCVILCTYMASYHVALATRTTKGTTVGLGIMEIKHIIIVWMRKQ